MNAGSFRDTPPGDDLDPRHEAVWAVLNRAPMPQPDPWFAASTLALCRREKRAVMSPARMWRWALGGGLGLCLAVSLLAAQVHSEQVDKQKNVQEAFEIMASIDSTDSDSSVPSST